MWYEIPEAPQSIKIPQDPEMIRKLSLKSQEYQERIESGEPIRRVDALHKKAVISLLFATEAELLSFEDAQAATTLQLGSDFDEYWFNVAFGVIALYANGPRPDIHLVGGTGLPE